MKVVTIDYQSFHCKFIKYEDDIVILTLIDNTEQSLCKDEIDYIAIS